MRPTPILLLTGLLMTPAVVAQDLIDTEFQVNTYTTSYQESPAIAVAPRGGGAAGDFVVVWASDGSEGTDQEGFSVQARRFGEGGEARSDEEQVNTYTTFGQSNAAVAVAPNGDFVVVWASVGSAGSDDSGASVQAQRFAANGTPQGSEIQVNSLTQFNQTSPAVAIAANGEFVVAWQSDQSAGSDTYSSIQARRFTANGTPESGEFQVNSYTTGYQSQPAVAMAADGSFAVAWTSTGSPGTDSSYESVQGRLFTADGSARTADFQVNTSTTLSQYHPALALTPRGDFVITWTSSVSSGGDTDFMSVQGQRFNEDGTPAGGEFQINETTSGAQRRPAVAMAQDRDFLVVWTSDTSSGSDDLMSSIAGRWFAADGAPLTDEFQVNTLTLGRQFAPALAVVPSGDFLVVWTSEDTDGSMTSVRGQWFQGSLFAEDFEKGDLLDWD